MTPALPPPAAAVQRLRRLAPSTPGQGRRLAATMNLAPNQLSSHLSARTTLSWTNPPGTPVPDVTQRRSHEYVYALKGMLL